MFKYIFLFVFLWSSILSASSLVNVKAGINMNSFGSDVNVDGKPGLLYGLTYSYFLTDVIGLYAGVQFANRPGELSNTKQDIKYTDIPFGLVYKFDRGNFATLGRFGLAHVSSSTDEVFGAKVESGLALAISSDMLFPVSDDFFITINIDLIYGLFDAFVLSNGVNAGDLTSFGFGAGLAYKF